jgi:hypothetical protein
VKTDDLSSINIQGHQVIAIDEAQFFTGLREFADRALSKGKHVIMAGLDGDFEQKIFGELISLIPLCDDVTKLHALCMNCGDGTPAPFTKRLVESKEQELVGDSLMYIAKISKGLYSGVLNSDIDFIKFQEESMKTVVEEEKNIHELSKQPIFTDFQNTIEQAIRLDVQEIYSTITPEQNPLIYNLMHRAQMECIRFRIVPDLSIFVNQPMVVSYVGDMPVLSLSPEPLDDEGNRIKKRVLDIIISLIAIIFVLSWLLPIIALLIIIESKGPVFFIQLRSGRNNILREIGT